MSFHIDIIPIYYLDSNSVESVEFEYSIQDCIDLGWLKHRGGEGWFWDRIDVFLPEPWEDEEEGLFQYTRPWYTDKSFGNLIFASNELEVVEGKAVFKINDNLALK